jgi:hypothetical protein
MLPSTYFFRLLLLCCGYCLLFTACESDPCEGLNCEQGVCDATSGECLCSRGYRTDDEGICTLTWSDFYAVTYSVYDSCKGPNAGVQTYTSNLTAAAPDQLLWENYRNTGRSLLLTQPTFSTVTVDIQSNDTLWTGTGTWQELDNSLALEYLLNDTTNQRIDTCFVQFTRL